MCLLCRQDGGVFAFLEAETFHLWILAGDTLISSSRRPNKMEEKDGPGGGSRTHTGSDPRQILSYRRGGNISSLRIQPRLSGICRTRSTFPATAFSRSAPDPSMLEPGPFRARPAMAISMELIQAIKSIVVCCSSSATFTVPRFAAYRFFADSSATTAALRSTVSGFDSAGELAPSEAILLAALSS